MGKALEVISGLVTAPGTTLTALTMAPGNSATIRNTDLAKPIALLQAWATTQLDGVFRVRSPKLHDNVQGIRMRSPAGINTPQIAPGWWQKLWPQDTLTLELSGSSTGGQIEQASLLIYYADLPGANARLITPAELSQRNVNVWTTEVPVTPSSAGQWTGQVAINSAFDQFKANTDYALIGMQADVLCHAIRCTSPDFANLGVGCPGNVTSRHVMSRWFKDLSLNFGIPLIPVFNAANKNSTLIDIAQNQAGGAVNVTVWLAELSTPNGQNVTAAPNPILS